MAASGRASDVCEALTNRMSHWLPLWMIIGCVKNLKNKVKEEELNKMVLLGKAKRYKEDVKRLERENQLSRQTPEMALDSFARESGSASKYFEWVLIALDSQYVELTMIFTQRFVSWCGKEGPNLKHFIVENVCEWSGRCEELCKTFALHRKWKLMVPTLLMLVPRDGRPYLPLYGTELLS